MEIGRPKESLVSRCDYQSCCVAKTKTSLQLKAPPLFQTPQDLSKYRQYVVATSNQLLK